MMRFPLMEQYREEGRIEGRQESILAILGDRFGTPPKDLGKRLRAVREPAQLRALLLLAARCESLDRFRQDWPAGASTIS